MPTSNQIRLLEEQLYQARLNVGRLRREVFEQKDPASSQALLDDLATAEADLAKKEAQLSQAIQAKPGSGLLVELGKRWYSGTLRSDTTGLEIKVHLRMAQVATSIYHLLDPQQNPLVTCTIQNFSDKVRRLRITSFIEDYSAKAINTVEVDPGPDPVEINQQPTLFPRFLQDVNELTRATLNVLVEELGETNERIESHTTHPIWLLARTTAPLALRDPKSGEWVDLSRYLGAFVTPNAPPLMAFLRQAAALHPQKRLVGYQGDPSQVEPQVRAIFEALKRQAEITYVNSVIAFSPDQGAANQRVRLPRECLEHHQANCVDGTVLFASLLEAISLNPAIVLIPGHALVGWQTWNDENGQWRYLETTMIGWSTFEEAQASGQVMADRYRKLAAEHQDSTLFRLWPLRALRAEYGITPLE